MESQTSIGSIKEKTAKLNVTADDATTKLLEVEKQLLEAGVGVEAWGGYIWEGKRTFSYHEGKIHSTKLCRQYLGFAKVEGTWGIAISENSCSNPVKNPLKTWDEKVGRVKVEGRYLVRVAPRDVRIRAASHIDELLKAIDVELDKRLKSLP